MKSKITKKLIVYFLIVILAFSFISGFLFLNLSKKIVERSSLKNLSERGTRIASFISNSSEFSSEGRGRMGSGYRRNNIKLMNELLNTDIRIINKNGSQVFSGRDNPVAFQDLDPKEKEIVERAFNGETSHTDKISLLNSDNYISLATPIKKDGQIIAALLLSENNFLESEFINSYLVIFVISTIIGAILVGLLAVFFANRFIEPLNKLNLATGKLIEGNYKISSGISQDDEIGDLAERLDTLAYRLETARLESDAIDKMRDDFISSMSHELKTPVTVLKSSLEALKEGVISNPSEVQEYHEVLFNEVGFLEKLINDLMDLNILKNSKFQMKMEEIDVINVLNDALRSQSLMAREKGISIEKNFTDDELPFVGDYTRIRQLFITLIDNGIKYSKENSNLVIEEKSDEDSFTCSIINFNSKIPEESLNHIFKPFYRDKNNNRKGFGLGLAIAKEIADAHNIKINVNSDDEKTEFIFIFKKMGN
ncbi:MAG: HAMP domain-containing histidine kinase [Tissierellia bacterium]|nr:HAMP domain-containing histidine kinase [Tissierellia bacterium]